MTKKYVLSRKAVDDLENIWFYTFQKWSSEQADRYYLLIIDEIQYISNHFDSGRLMEHIKAGYRVTKVKFHLIFYRKNQADQVEIVRILHERMDLENRLND